MSGTQPASPVRGEDRALPREPIAIIGIGCRFPRASDPESFWRLLWDGVDAITEVPAERFDVDAVYDPRPATPGRTSTRWGGFLEGVDLFDHAFFAISPREATRMDPQQRLLLEVTWEALEDAGQIVPRLAASRTGVFIGLCTGDYEHMLEANPLGVDIYSVTGSARSVVSGRVSYAFDLRGPSVTVDTACSSSLVAVHLACQSLWSGETTMALAGGVNLVLSPAPSIGFSQANMMALDGRCKVFDARGDGFVRSDGVAVVVLRPLALALADGDPIHAVIRGSASNNDGRSSGLLMMPGLAGQESVLREAYRSAGISPGTVDYVEAHGTGTVVGDPIEARALGAVLAEGRAADRPCAIGSVKTNIGHAEGAAGVAGLIKATLCLKHRAIPPSLQIQELNPRIPWRDLPLAVQREGASWPEYARPARAGVSSFGISGANVHVVLEEAPLRAEAGPAPTDRCGRPFLLPLSARSAEALKALVARHHAFLADPGGDAVPGLRDVCYTAGVRRTHHDHRFAAVARSRAEFAERLEAFLRGDVRPGVSSGRRDPGTALKLAFVFPGQGAQWWAMGRELLEQEPVFREAVERCDALFRSQAGWSLLQELTADEARSRLDHTEFAQPAIFALQVALAAMWRSWGIEPDAVVGHSLGEVAAAYISGALSLEDAGRIVVHRGRVMARTAGRGKMAAVGLSCEAAARALVGHESRLSIAAINGPDSIVLSGEPEALDSVLRSFDGREIVSRYLTVNYAFHSPQMEPLQASLREALTGLRPRPASLPIVSTVTGQTADGSELGPDHWGHHLRSPVRFAEAILQLAEAGHTIFLELSPHPTLLGAIAQCLRHRGQEGSALPSLRRGEAEREALLGTLGALYARGYPVDFSRLYSEGGGQCVRLPSYPWQRERFWIDDAGGSEWRPGLRSQHGGKRHPLLGRQFRSAHPIWENEVDRRSLAYLEDHRIQDTVLVPAAAFVEMAWAAAAETFGTVQCALSEIEFRRALFLPEDKPRIVQLVLSPDGDRRASFGVYARADATDQTAEPWVLCATGEIRADQSPGGLGAAEPVAIEAIQARCPQEITGRDYYRYVQAFGFQFGPSFQGIERLWRADAESLGRIRVPESLVPELDHYHFHPAVLDAGFQVVARAGTYIPVSVERVRIHGRPGRSLWSHVRVRSEAADGFEADLRLLDDDGRLIAEVSRLALRRVGLDGSRRPEEHLDDWLYEIRWQPRDRTVARDVVPGGKWLILADAGGVGRALADLLEGQGDRCILATPGDAFEVTSDGSRAGLDPARPEQIARLVEQAIRGEETACRGIVHLWGLDSSHPDGAGLAALDSAEILGPVSVLHLVQALATAGPGTPPRLWVVSRGAHAVGSDAGGVSVAQAPVWGLARVIAHEHPELRCTAVDLGHGSQAAEIRSLSDEIRAGEREDQVALRGEARYVARLVRAPRSPAARPEVDPASAPTRLAIPESRPFRLEMSAPGLLDGLVLKPVPRRAPGRGEVEIEVVSAGLNFRDVMKAMGIYPVDHPDALWLGDECAGRISAVGEGVEGFRVSDEVLAIAPASFGAFATTLASHVLPKPAQLTFEEAVTIPTVFTTAYYALCVLGRLAPGERVLIHAAAGGVGLAAVQISQWVGAEIFATAGNPEKRAYLGSLGIPHVMDSRSLAFADEIIALTGGQGVDVVLNSLAGEAIPKSLSVLGAGGRFLEIGKRDIYENAKLGLRPFKNGLSFFAVSMDRVYQHHPETARFLLREVVRLFQDGVLRPLPHRVFPVEEAVSAFRYMAQAKHIGKVVLAFPPLDLDRPGPEARGVLRSDATYLITGGLGSLGLAIARWMVERGARHLALVGRTGAPEAAHAVLQELRSVGARVEVIRADVTRDEALGAVLTEMAGSMPPVRGVVHAAGVLDDGILVRLNAQRFAAVTAPKIRGAWNLHTRTADLPLDFFVLFSSVASILGSPGQGNYAAANAFLDSLAHHRRSRGLPAVSINWGPWAEIGMAARPDLADRFALQGIRAIPPTRCLEALERLLDAASPQVAVLSMDWRQWFRIRPPALESPLLEELAREVETGGSREGRGRLREALLAAAPEERQGILESHLQRELARVLQLDPAKLDVATPLITVGLDSLMAIELKVRVETELGAVLPMLNLLQGPSIAQLASHLLGLLKDPSAHDTGAEHAAAAVRSHDGDGDPGPPAAEPLSVTLDRLSDEDVDSLLTDMLAGEESREQHEPTSR